MSNPLLGDKPGEKHLLLGNEAIVRGVIEGGVDFVSCYPGTPSSEVPDAMYRLSPEAGYYFEYSTNEKVALEVGGGASLGGAATLVTMKHVGVNVAADPLMTLAYIGVPGGLVLLSADDPGCHSSQNEQDNRYYARLAGICCLEPATAQEAKDMARQGLMLSRQWEHPVMLRTTTRVNHLRGVVEFGPLPKEKEPKPPVKAPGRFVPVPAVARIRRVELLKHLEILKDFSEESEWNILSGQGETGIIASGISRAYLADALAETGLADQVRVLELGVTYPLPEKKIASLLDGCKRVIVLEELEPIIETEVRALAQRLGSKAEITGKGESLPRDGEYSTDLLKRFLTGLLTPDTPYAPAICQGQDNLPLRPPNLCAGCSHRALYYAVRKVFGDEPLYSSDIGCYTLGILPPLSCADFLLCMGSSVSAGSGMAKASGRPVVGFIGDSTFFHSGISGLVNAVYNQHDLLLVVMDNHTTAMTGHQPHPSVRHTSLGKNPSRVDIEAIVRGCGVEEVRKVSPYKLKPTLKALQEMKEKSGVRVVIAEEPCVLFARRTLKHKPLVTAAVKKQSAGVQECLETLACPAFYRDGQDVAVDPNQCTGCMVCIQITDDIKAVKRS